jgi:hypothetical protein
MVSAEFISQLTSIGYIVPLGTFHRVRAVSGREILESGEDFACHIGLKQEWE